jgi:hypothetical protein
LDLPDPLRKTGTNLSFSGGEKKIEQIYIFDFPRNFQKTRNRTRGKNAKAYKLAREIEFAKVRGLELEL